MGTVMLEPGDVAILAKLITGDLFREDEAERAVVQKLVAAANMEQPIRLPGHAAEQLNPRRFVRKEREHLDVLKRRLEWIRGNPERDDDAGQYAGEGNALAWIITLVEGTDIDDPAVRFARVENRIRILEAKVGRIESEWREQDDEDDE